MKNIIIATLFLLALDVYAQDINMPKSEWLKRLEPILVPHLCAKESPFVKGYKGSDCISDVTFLFKKCTTEVENVYCQTQ